MIGIEEKGYASHEDQRPSSPTLASTFPFRSPSAAALPSEDKAKPDFALSGLLAAAMLKRADGTNTPLKYIEPPEARKLLVGWEFYVFKGDEQVGEQSSPILIPLHFPLPRVLYDLHAQRRLLVPRKFAPYNIAKVRTS